VASLAWGFAAFAFGARVISPLAGGLLGLAVLSSAAVTVLTMHLRDRRMLALAKGACPRCGGVVAFEHRHRRWQPESASWAAAAANWDCGSCGFTHAESWPCPTCPSA
jgi:ribosomal protein S27AE